MTPIISAMIQQLWPKRHDPEIREQLRRCLAISKNHVKVRGYEVPGRDHSRDLRLQELSS